jgi:hypothetical protein
MLAITSKLIGPPVSLVGQSADLEVSFRIVLRPHGITRALALSHAAAALPFRRLRPVWPAVVIGTFAPNLQYFLWISDEDRSGHHFPNAFTLALPLAFLVL